MRYLKADSRAERISVSEITQNGRQSVPGGWTGEAETIASQIWFLLLAGSVDLNLYLYLSYLYQQSRMWNHHMRRENLIR